MMVDPRLALPRTTFVQIIRHYLDCVPMAGSKRGGYRFLILASNWLILYKHYPAITNRTPISGAWDEAGSQRTERVLRNLA